MKSSWQIELVLLGAIWGASFLFMRETGAVFGAVVLIFLRTFLAFLTLLPVIIWRRRLHLCFRHWQPLLVLGIANTAVPFCFFAWATPQLGAGFTSILNACAPFFAAIIAAVWLKDRLSGWQMIGLMTGFTGVAVLTIKPQNSGAEVVAITSLLPVIAALAASALYGWSAAYIKRSLKGVPPLTVATGSMMYASICLCPFAILLWPPTITDVRLWAYVIALASVSTGFAYILYFRLVEKKGVSTAVSVTFLVPVFGTLWGAWFAGESLSMTMLLGGLLVLAGLGISQRKAKLVEKPV